MKQQITIGITGTGSLIGQSIIKSINNINCDSIDIIGFDYFKNTIGSFWVNRNYILPDILNPKISENMWLDFLMDVITVNKIDLLFIGVDFELQIFSKNKEKIEQETGCKVIVSSETVIDIANDKYKTFKFLKSNSFSYPNTFLLDEYKTGLLDFPFILKPRIGARSRGVYIINNQKELEEKQNIISNQNSYIAQELIGKMETEYTCGTIYFDNIVRHSIALQRELRDGNTWVANYSNEFPNNITEYVEEITKKLKPFGSCNFQLRMDNNDTPKLFEINPRFSGTTHIRSLFGYYEIEYIIDYLMENKLPEFNLKEGIVRRYFEEFYSKI